MSPSPPTLDLAEVIPNPFSYLTCVLDKSIETTVRTTVGKIKVASPENIWFYKQGKENTVRVKHCLGEQQHAESSVHDSKATHPPLHCVASTSDDSLPVTP